MTAHRQPRINAIGTAVPGREVHGTFIDWAARHIEGTREHALFLRMAERSGIARRWSVVGDPAMGARDVRATDPDSFYGDVVMPGTAARMAIYAAAAPPLALAAIRDLADHVSLDGITHVVVASCTGFTAPGLDQIIARELGLAADVERLFVGFMGCYAGATALRSAWHLVRSQPDARVLVLCLELTTLHLQATGSVEQLLAMLQFGDGAAAALVTGEGGGLAISGPIALALAESADLIRWDISDTGFVMHLSGQVPGRIQRALEEPDVRAALIPDGADAIGEWAVHGGGRSILDSVERGLTLTQGSLADSRAVLNRAWPWRSDRGWRSRVSGSRPPDGRLAPASGCRAGADGRSHAPGRGL